MIGSSTEHSGFVVFQAEGRGTKMIFTEQIAFLDGYNDRAERIRGTEIGLDKLVLSLQELRSPPH